MLKKIILLKIIKIIEEIMINKIVKNNVENNKKDNVER